MFRNKSEVDQYVVNSLQKIKSERERNLRSLHAAQLYFKVQDFESARKYVLMYLSEKEDAAIAHKLLGDALEGLGQKTKAIAAYKRSLEIQGSQSGLLLKICELLCSKDIEFDPGMAKYCLDRVSPLFPHAPAVFSLKEKLLSADSNVTQDDFERLIIAELKARPSDVNVRVKLLKLHLDLKKVELAYNHVVDVESKQLHSNSLVWYQCSSEIFKAYYDNFPKKCDWEFFVMWMSALDRRCYLSLDETNGESCDIVVNTDAIYTLDQTVHLSTQKVAKAPEIYLEFLRHITGQLAFHLAVLLMKRARKETSMWKETKKTISPLLMFSACDPPNTDANWCLSIKENQRKSLNIWAHQGRCRFVQSGHLLNALAKECQTVKMFIDKVNHFAVTDWRKRVYEKTFLSVDDISFSTSYFVTSASYASIPQKIPFLDNLKPSLYVQSIEMNYLGSLHHLVWLGLQVLQNPRSVLTCRLSSFFHTTLFKNNLQYTVSNLHNTGVETLNQLDVDAFLFATIFCTGAILEDHQVNGYFSPDRPALLPANITPTLCTQEQAKWWASACSITNAGGRSLGNNVKMSDLRHNLQRGIEVVRGDGLPLPLLVILARTFGLMGSDADSIEESEGCENRAVDLWKIAVPLLERLSSNQSTNKFTSKTKLFEYATKDLLPNEINALLDEGRYYIASNYMNKEQYERALDVFKLLRTPQSNYNMAHIYLKLAEEQMSGLRGEEITSDLRCKHAVLATKARDALQVARDIIKGDSNHPLQHKIKTKFIEVEDLLSRIERENGFERDASDASISLGSGGSPSVEKLATPLTLTKNHSRNPAAASTPRLTMENRVRPNNSDMTDLMNLQQSSNQLKLQQIMEQSKLILDRMDSIIFEQRSQRSLIEDLTAKFNHMETEVKTVLADIKKEVKKSDLYNMLDDDDYGADEISNYQYPTITPQNTSRVTMVYPPNQRAAVPPEAQFVGTVPQYFSPRVDQMYQNSVNFFNSQGTLPFVDGQTVPDYLRGLNHPKFPQGIPNTMAAPLPPVVPMGLNQGAPMMPNPAVAIHGLLPQPKFSTSAGMTHGLTEHGFPGRGPTNVVITTSDTLPTGTPPAQPTLSVTIPPQHRLGDSSAAHQFQISFPTSQNLSQTRPAPMQVSATAKVTEVVESDDDTESQPSFEAIASSLPIKTNLVTGEENEDVLFEKRAKLFKFSDQAWKEKGVGNIKILKSKTENKYRILMRRDKVHDICANHFITADMKLEFLQDKSWFWVAQDFSEEISKLEKFSVRFKQAEECKEFKKVFDGVVAALKTGTTASQTNVNVDTTTQTNVSVSSVTSTPKDHHSSTPERSSILAPSRLFSGNVSVSSTQSPSNTLFGTPQSSTSMFGKTPTSSPGFGVAASAVTGRSLFGTDAQKSVPTNIPTAGVISFKTTPSTTPSVAPEKTTFGGFTFSTTPKVVSAPEPKVEQKEVEPKKTDSPFANWSFSKTTDNKSGFGISGDNQKSVELNKPLFGVDRKSDPNEPLFGSKPTFSDFGSLAKSASNQESTLSKLLTENKTPSSNIFPGAGAPVFGSKPLGFQSPAAVNSSLGGGVSSPQENEDDFVPSADFAPVIPLPELVDVKSGEENEEILFKERAKLFRYDKNIKEWRDRGVGDMKILKSKETGIIRLLMRREQVHKVCCNHRLTKDLELTKSKTNEKAYCWNATDFSDDTNGTFQQFTIRFKTAEQGLNFEETFKNAQATITASPTKPVNQGKTDDKPPLSSLVTKAQGSWDCDACLINNSSSATSCVACGSSKPGVDPSPKKDQKPKSTFTFGMPSAVSTGAPTQNVGSNLSQAAIQSSAPTAAGDSKPPLSSLVKKAPGSWECTVCYVTNDAKNSKCISCSTPQPGSKPSSSAPPVPEFSFGIPPDATKSAEAAKFSFGMPSTAKSEQKKQLFGSSTSTKKTEDSSKLPPLSSLVTQPEGSWECKSCYTRNDDTALRCIACETNRPNVTVLSTSSLSTGATPFSFGNVGASLPSQTTNITNEVTITPVTDSSKKEAPSAGFTFGTGGVKGFGFGDSAETAKSSKPVFSFGGSISGNESFGKSTFQFSMPTFDPKSPAKNDASDNEVSDREDHNDSIHFEPVVPLPDLVATKTGEEDETALYSHRAKLFRFDGNAKEWKERGLGDIKILQHNTTGKKRLLMRREPVMKLCLNHYLTDAIEMKPQDEKSWMWFASDFSLGEKCEEKFAIRFKTKEIAQEFFEAIEKAKQKTDPPSEPAAAKSSSSSEADDDVVYVDTIMASEELVKKARALKLPDNFYLYLDRPPCPGCVGCEPEDDDNQQVLAAGDSLQATLSLKPIEKGLSAVEPTKATMENPFSAGPKPSEQSLSTSQPLFGNPTTTFSFKQASLPFGASDKTSQSAPQSFFSKDVTSFASPLKSTQGSIFGNVSSTTASMGVTQSSNQPSPLQPSIFSKDMPSFGSIASSSPSFGNNGPSAPGFLNKDIPTFGALAANASPAAPPSFLAPKKDFSWEGAGTSLFSHLSNQPAPVNPNVSKGEGDGEQGGEDDDPEKESQGIHFEPIVPLPEKIELSTGEEEEEVLFNERAKLFRYSPETKEWKERGVGAMKVLRHKTNNTYRLLMRREQVHKIVCNQRISADLVLAPMPNSETSTTWASMNLAQEYTEPQAETLALKLKNKDLLAKFLSVVNDAVASLK
uniref:E3 SUMO-protein ligase RanBP2 n=1 Tax=Lygus hesperus TaxID=30085 RepID=A0A146LQV5_LYGHE